MTSFAAPLWLPFFTVLALCCGTAAAEEGSEISIAFVGDIMLDDTPGKVVRQGRDPFAYMAATLKNADIRVGNLECVIATTGSPEPGKPYTFRASPASLQYLKRHFDALGLANNHSGDYGPQAFEQMLGLLEKQGIEYFGGGRNLARAHRPLIVERRGLRIALLGYDEFFPRSFEADTDRAGIAWSEDEEVRRDIMKARSEYGADLVIPFMHWGFEHEPLASARQHELARLMIDAGADAVVGGHPHVTQDIELYRNKPIIYSLGNFVFDGFDSEDNNTGWLLSMVMDKAGVKRLRIHIAHIDRQGSPHPDRRRRDICWESGQLKESECDKD